jgi:hypothetical protein
MSLSVLLSPSPGWYPDPAGQAVYRWWDGDAWTEGTHDGETLGSRAPEPAFEVVPSASATASVTSPAEPATASFAEAAFADPERFVPVALFAEPEAPPAPSTAAPARAAAHAPVKTKWSSLLLAFPFVFPIAIGMVIALAYAGGAAGNMIALAMVGGIAALVLLAVAFMFADHDRRDLKAAGYQPVPSLGWMLLLPPIAYLLVRRRIVGPRY